MKRVYTLPNAHTCPQISNDKKSPFAIYPNEGLKKTQLSSPAISSVIIDDVDKVILYLLNQLLFSTSALLEIAMQNLGVDIEQKQIQKRLKYLDEREYVRSYRFVSSETYSSGKTYTLNWRGYGYLKSAEIKPKLRQYIQDLIESQDVVQIKKILSAQQFALRNEYDIEDIDICKTVFVLVKEGQTTKKIFRSQAMLSDGERTIFLESVRRTDSNWKQEFMKKLDRIGSTLQTSKEHNITLKKADTTLILIAEDSDHMSEIMKLVDSAYLCFPATIQYTSDPMVFNNHECVYDIKQSWLSRLFDTG